MTHRILPRIASCLALLTATDVAISSAQQPDLMEDETRYIRVERNSKNEPTTLQTSIARFQSKSGDMGLTIDLIGAVHIGEAGYYEKLNEQFKNYDVVLYELVAPKGALPTSSDRSENPVSMIQGMARTVLNLESQLEHIDYSAPNFVHADMTPQEIGESMEKRGDSGLSVALDVLADVIREGNKQQKRMEEGELPTVPSVDPIAMLFAADRDVQLKRMMAEQFASMEAMDTGLGPTLNRMLISDRNEAAMRVLREEIAKGRKKIGIFYGAAHMTDFAERLENGFGLRPTKTKWLTAWDLTSQSAGIQDPLQGLMKQLLEEAAQ